MCAKRAIRRVLRAQQRLVVFREAPQRGDLCGETIRSRKLFFNPITEKYETLTGKQLPITVEGTQATPTPALAAQNSPGTGAAASPAMQATPAPSDILYIRTDAGRWVKSFEPIYRSREFWVAQLAPMAALLAFVGLRVRRARLSDLRAQQLLAWRREKSEALRMLRRSDVSEADALDAAVRCIQLETAMILGREPATLDAAEACASRQLDAQSAERVRSLFAARAELRYAGAARGAHAQTITSERRDEILETVKRFEEATAHV